MEKQSLSLYSINISLIPSQHTMAKSPPKDTTALDAEAGIPLVENNATNTNTGNANAAAVSTSTSTSAIRGVRFNESISTGTGAYRRQGRHNRRRRESWFSRQRSTLRRQYNVDPNEGGVGEIIGDMANTLAENEDLEKRNAELSLRVSALDKLMEYEYNAPYHLLYSLLCRPSIPALQNGHQTPRPCLLAGINVCRHWPFQLLCHHQERDKIAGFYHGQRRHVSMFGKYYSLSLYWMQYFLSHMLLSCVYHFISRNTSHRGVEVDSTGMAHLTDKQGRDMSTRATGDLYSAELIRTPSGRKLHCVTVEDAANMAHSIASGADANVALMDESGVLEQEILSLSGNFEDAGDALDFASGNIRVLLDDDSCNVDEAGESDNENKDNTDLFTRGLEKGFSIQKRSDILAKNREIYFKHRAAALKTGGEQRVLNLSPNKVPVTITTKNDAVLTSQDISDFTEILFTEAQQSFDGFALESYQQQLPDDDDELDLETITLINTMELFEESHGKMEMEVKNQLLTVLAVSDKVCLILLQIDLTTMVSLSSSSTFCVIQDNSTDQFDDFKILMIEKQEEEGKNVCELGLGNLCKGEKKSNMEKIVHEAVLQGIQEASEFLDKEPDIEVILLGVQEKLGVNVSTIEWFIQVSTKSICTRQAARTSVSMR